MVRVWGVVLVLMVGCGNSGPEAVDAAPDVAATPDPAPLAGDVLVLITEEEAASDEASAEVRGLADFADGPELILNIPQNGQDYAAPMSIDVLVKAGANGLEPSMDSLKVTYVKGFGFDVTGRIRPYIQGTELKVPSADLPKGSHTLRIYIEDEEQNVTAKKVSFSIH